MSPDSWPSDVRTDGMLGTSRPCDLPDPGTLVVHGSEDPLFPPAHGEALAAQIPSAHLEIVPGMGHHPFFAPGLTQRIAELIVGHTT